MTIHIVACGRDHVAKTIIVGMDCVPGTLERRCRELHLTMVAVPGFAMEIARIAERMKSDFLSAGERKVFAAQLLEIARAHRVTVQLLRSTENSPQLYARSALAREAPPVTPSWMTRAPAAPTRTKEMQ